MFYKEFYDTVEKQFVGICVQAGYIKFLKPPPKILWLHLGHQIAIVQGSGTQRFSSLSLTYQRQINRDDVKIPPYSWFGGLMSRTRQYTYLLQTSLLELIINATFVPLLNCNIIFSFFLVLSYWLLKEKQLFKWLANQRILFKTPAWSGSKSFKLTMHFFSLRKEIKSWLCTFPRKILFIWLAVWHIKLFVDRHR